MAARLILFLAVVVAAVGCTGGTDQPTAQGALTPPPVAVTPAIDAARSAISDRLYSDGFDLTQTFGYDPGQPASLQTVQRATFQLNLIDPNQGFVVIYDLGTADGALAAGADFAAYLRSFGHSNYPADAEFTLNAVDSALVFYWWSRERSNDADRAARAFALIASVGQQVTVIN